MSKVNVWISLIFLSFLLLWSGCESNRTLPEINYEPVIKYLDSKPYALVGDKIEVEGVAVDSDQDELNFSWKIDGKLVSTETTVEKLEQGMKGTLVLKPEKEKVYKVEMVVSDNEETVSESVKVDVRDNTRIKPGEEAAGVKLMEDNIEVTNEIYGTPLIIDIEEDSDIRYIYKPGLIVYPTDKNENLLPDDNELINYIIVFGQYKGKTAGGNGIGSLRNHVEVEFGPPEEEKKGEDITWCYYYSIGITFFYNNNTSRVEYIHLYK